MSNEANNSGQNANDGGDNNTGTSVAQSSRNVDGIDPTISKHLDMAIEAQDGPKEPEKKEEGDAETAGKEEADDKKQKPSDSQSSSSNDSAQKQPSKEGKEDRPSNGAKDLKLADGSIVRGGAERRFYEQREAARHEVKIVREDLQRAQSDLEKAKTELQSIQSAAQSLHGVEPQIAAVGVKIVKDLQSDPVGTLKKLLAEAAAQGYNVNDLGVGIDTAAVQRMLDERLPKNDQKQLSEADIVAESQKEVTAFFTKFPDAKPHDALIAKVLRDHPDETLTSVYFTLKNAFAEQGYDWSVPLEQQLQASDPQNKNGQAQNQQQDKSKAPLPDGGGNGDAEFKLNDRAPAHEDLDTSEIVRAAMRENGFKV